MQFIRRGHTPALIAVPICLFCVMAGFQWLGTSNGPDMLLCSDGRCGQSSKLSQQDAQRDLDMWADKEELKNRLDELQTVMDRGMTHKSASQSLNQYFDKLDHQVQDQKRAAMRQKRSEGLLTTLSSASVHHAETVPSSTDIKRVSPSDSTKPAGQPASKGDYDATRDLNAYFDQQERSIRAENLHQQEATATKLSAAAAAADLNAYFDSLPTGSRESKVRTLEQTVKTLTGEVKSLTQPLSDMRAASHQTAQAVSALRDQQAKLMADDAHHQRDVEQAEARAAAAAADAAKADAAAEAAARRKTAVVLANIRPKAPARAVNPSVKVLGLPPGWKSYMDLRTKYTYFYNPRTRESTWESPAGTPESIVGLPDGWRAFKAKGGKLYYFNRKQAVSTWDDPRLLPGAKVLSLLDSMDQVILITHSAKEYQLTLLLLFSFYFTFCENVRAIITSRFASARELGHAVACLQQVHP